MSAPRMNLNLDDLLIFLLKIGCNGYDHYVLQGAIPYLAHRTMFIFFEKKSEEQTLVPVEHTVKLLWEQGFGCFLGTRS